MELEHALLKTPYESLNRTFRNAQKNIEKEIAQVVNAVSELEKKKGTISQEDAFKSIDKLVGKLQGLKRKLDESKKDESEYLQKCKSRIDHLAHFSEFDLKKCNDEPVKKWHRIRLDRILVDYLLRNGFYDTAIELAKDSNITELVDLDVFLNAKKVIESLSQRDCKEALKWCAENRSKLRKLNSSLEFALRMQEYIELVRNQQLKEAIQHARKHFVPSLTTNEKEIQVAMASIAFLKDTSCERYKVLFDEKRWNALVQQFQDENYRLYGLSEYPVLTINMHAGLSALKTSFCYEDDNTNINCPICSPAFRKLAKEIPFAHHTHSSLICRITGQLMSDDNPPLVLPNGNAYSKAALLQMASENEGNVTDPRTKEVFRYEELKKAFIS